METATHINCALFFPSICNEDGKEWEVENLQSWQMHTDKSRAKCGGQSRLSCSYTRIIT